jgi:hypothetical protein
VPKVRCQTGSIFGIGEGELDESVEVALEVADVVPALAGREPESDAFTSLF